MKNMKTILLVLMIIAISIPFAPMTSGSSQISDYGFLRFFGTPWNAPREYCTSLNGQLASQTYCGALYAALGKRFGSSGYYFRLPNLEEVALSNSLDVLLQGNTSEAILLKPTMRYAGSDPLFSYTGQIHLYAGNAIPEGWSERLIPCDGRELVISDYQNLFNVLGTTFGGDGRTTFNVPDLRATSSGTECTASGNHLGTSNLQFLIDGDGDDPTTVDSLNRYTSEIIMFAGSENKMPKGFLLCDGRAIDIPQHTVLYSLIGTLYGGNVTDTFKLPDFRNGFPVGRKLDGSSRFTSCTKGPIPRFTNILFVINDSGVYPPPP